MKKRTRKRFSAPFPERKETIALAGYMIVSNNQIHDFELEVLMEYFEEKDRIGDFEEISKILDCKEDAVSEEVALDFFETETDLVKTEIVYLVSMIGWIDGNLDYNEEKLLKGMLEKASDIHAELKETVEKAKRAAEDLRKKYKKSEVQSNYKGRRARKNESKYENIFRITQNEYNEAIKRCCDIAREDFKIIKPIHDEINNECKRVANKLEMFVKNNSKQNQYQVEVMESLQSLSNIFRDEIIMESEMCQKAFLSKENAINDFTISLVGRTKAGKSTLHAILTGEGKDKIGEGMQRTTRYNRVYEWNRIRLIDTPGIGAAEAEGRSDDKIAEMVIGESDLVCYIQTDDSILEDTKKFIEKICKKNKPVIILLNHKDNIKHPVKLKRFLENPLQWYEDVGENRISGYIDPIRRYAKENGFDHMVSIYPVFLLAELMAQDEKYSMDAKALHKGSCIDDFLAQLKILVAEKGTILRSKTILDDTVHICNEWSKSIGKINNEIDNRIIMLKKSKNDILKRLQKEKTRCMKSVEKIVDSELRNLADVEAMRFAEMNYENRDNLEKMWEAHIKKISFDKAISHKIEAILKDFENEVMEAVNDLLEDIDFSMSSFETKGFKIKGGVEASFRNFTRLLGSLLGIGGSILLLSNPVGWVVIGVGAAVGLISNLFKSKAKKKQEAVKKMYVSIHDGVNQNKSKIKKDCAKKVDTYCDKAIGAIEKIFCDLLNGLTEIMKETEGLKSHIDRRINEINNSYGLRILNYIAGTFDYHISNIIKVEREFGKTMDLHTNVTPIVDMTKLEGIVKEKVMIF